MNNFTGFRKKQKCLGHTGRACCEIAFENSIRMLRP